MHREAQHWSAREDGDLEYSSLGVRPGRNSHNRVSLHEYAHEMKLESVTTDNTHRESLYAWQWVSIEVLQSRRIA